jgi:type IV pilus assembly protein PilA
MREQLRKRLEGRTEEGFTLIELMVVVLIIAILLAIAIPSFLGARARAQDRAAQSNLRNALTAEKTYYTDAQAYTNTLTAMQAIEPSLNWITGTPTANSKDVSVDKASVATPTAVPDAVVCVTALSASGTTFAIKDVASGANAGTYFYKNAITCDESVGPLKW